MKRMMLAMVLGVGLEIGMGTSVGAQRPGVTAEDYYRIREVGEVAMAPDGRHVAYTVVNILEKENRRRAELFLVPVVDGASKGEAQRLSAASADASQLRWSPDGTVLSYQSREAGRSGIEFRRVSAPATSVPIPGVHGAPTWSPDGAWIAFTWAVPADTGLTGARARAGWIAPDARTRTLDAERMDGRVITAMAYKADGTLDLLPHPSVMRHRQLYVVPAAGGQPTPLTALPFSVSEPVWSGDGRHLYFSGDSLWAIPSVKQTRDIYVVAREGGPVRRLTSNPGSEYAPAVSPDGRLLAFLSVRETGGDLDLLVASLDATGAIVGIPRNLTTEWDLNPGAPMWMPDGRSLRFTAGIGGNEHVFEVPLTGGGVRQITTGDRQLNAVTLSKDARVMAYAATTADLPSEVFLAGRDGAAERRITRLNDEWLAGKTIMPTERITWTVEDGAVIEGWLVKPVGYTPGRKYPMVLKIHGGPHGAYGQTFFQTFHLLSGSGFFVLYSNPRGSSNYGNRFEYATRGNWHVMDSEDYLNGVEAALARYPEIDNDRLGVSGGSYGGVSTNWLTATSNRFAAAVSSRGIANWYSWWGMSDIPNMTEFEFFGFPWEQPERYTRLSPLTHVANVTAPTLIIEGEQDWRTPMGEGEQWYMALQKLDVPTELIRYPRSSHGLSRTGEPWLLVDRLERLRSWFDYWLIQHPEQLPARRAYPAGVNFFPNGSKPKAGK
jgi:dipeptidyl aminopeptidase/acylaminoacyl peptidase